MKKKGINHAVVGDYVWLYANPEPILRISRKYFFCYNKNTDTITRYYKKRCKVVYQINNNKEKHGLSTNNTERT